MCITKDVFCVRNGYLYIESGPRSILKDKKLVAVEMKYSYNEDKNYLQWTHIVTKCWYILFWKWIMLMAFVWSHMMINFLQTWLLIGWQEVASQSETILEKFTLLCHHSGCNGITNHQPHTCLLNRSFRHRSKKASKLCVTGLCVGNSLVTVDFPAQMASNTENVSIWWCHHVRCYKNVMCLMGI